MLSGKVEPDLEKAEKDLPNYQGGTPFMSVRLKWIFATQYSTKQ